MLKGLCFASGVIFGALLACAACSQTPAYSTSPYGPVPGGGGVGRPVGYLALPSRQCWSGEVVSASGEEV